MARLLLACYAADKDVQSAIAQYETQGVDPEAAAPFYLVIYDRAPDAGEKSVQFAIIDAEGVPTQALSAKKAVAVSTTPDLNSLYCLPEVNITFTWAQVFNWTPAMDNFPQLNADFTPQPKD